MNTRTADKSRIDWEVVGKVQFVSGSRAKEAELAGVICGLLRVDIDLPEVQAIDSRDVITAKLRAARERIPEGAILVEDTALHLACLALGILISTVTPSQQLAFMLSVMLTLLPTFLLSGFVFPLRNMPFPIRAFAYLFPTTYYLEILKALLVKGAGFASYWRDAAALAAYALLAGLAATARFARSRGR